MKIVLTIPNEEIKNAKDWLKYANKALKSRSTVQLTVEGENGDSSQSEFEVNKIELRDEDA